MSVLDDLRTTIDHITAATGDNTAWQRGLTPSDLAAINAAVIDPAAVTGLLAKIRANHPGLFDAAGAPNTPPAGTGQRGEAAEAMKKAEDDLAQQNSSTAQLDLHVIGAILNAHTAAVAGSSQLDRLQDEIEAAVRSRIDLDTPAGARDFQRFLISKLREIGAVVESANLDDRSKAALASAWTALYSATDAPAVAASSPAPAAPISGPTAATVETTSPSAGSRSADPLPAYGADLGDPMLDALLADDVPAPADPRPVTPAVPAAGAAPPAPQLPMMTPQSLPLPAMTGLADLARAAVSGTPGRFEPALSDDELAADPALAEQDSLTDADLDEPAEDTVDETVPDACAEAAVAGVEDTAPAPAATTVLLPDGTTVQAATPQLAKVLESAVAGTPVVAAFGNEGIAVPPPGSAVPRPLELVRVVGGDIGMFPDRQAIALDQHRALLDGRIQPLASVNGPSFLGWLHPPGQVTESTPARPANAGAR